MSTVSTSNYKGSSFFANYLPSLADRIYKNGTDYGAWPIINLTNMYTCGGMATTIPAKDTTDDP